MFQPENPLGLISIISLNIISNTANQFTQNVFENQWSVLTIATAANFGAFSHCVIGREVHLVWHDWLNWWARLSVPVFQWHFPHHPNLASKVWGIYCEHSGKKCPYYDGTATYNVYVSIFSLVLVDVTVWSRSWHKCCGGSRWRI